VILDILAKISDAVGIMGVIILLIAYYLLSINKMSSQSTTYQLCNLIGAILITYSLMFHWNTASVLIETAWVIISLIGLYRIRKTYRKSVNTNNLVNISTAKKKQNDAQVK
jgi:membrane-bound ClpP family serine protease